MLDVSSRTAQLFNNTEKKLIEAATKLDIWAGKNKNGKLCARDVRLHLFTALFKINPENWHEPALRDLDTFYTQIEN